MASPRSSAKKTSAPAGTPRRTAKKAVAGASVPLDAAPARALPSPAEIEAKTLSLAAAAAREAKKWRADGVMALDVRGLADYADAFVFAATDTPAQLRGLAKQLEKTLREAGAMPLSPPQAAENWICLDFGDLILHLFDRAARDYYRLEEMWGDAQPIAWEEETPKPAARAPRPPRVRRRAPSRPEKGLGLPDKTSSDKADDSVTP